MGIPRFYRWLSERYPLINEHITADEIPEFDNLYIDMNGIIHTCSHNNTGGLCTKDETDVPVEVFNYIVRLFHIIRPKKFLYLAIDGCAPRAKMNQQRARRFRAANDAREARENAKEMGEEVSGTVFDSNCITPGTEFMGMLTEHLRFFIIKKIHEDPMWQGVNVLLSGPDVPGEGEHKIMDYIRTSKAQTGHDPNLRHCLYGLDADLIMLSLVSHEPHFALLREEVLFGRRATEHVEQRMLVSKDRFQLLHISLLREYLDLEFTPPRDAPATFEYNLERVIDDFILFCVLVGNDFLPCLPFAEIGEGGLDTFFAVYKEHLQAAATRLPWLTGDCGKVQFDQLASFLQRYADTEHKQLEAAMLKDAWVLGRRRMVGPADAPDPPSQGCIEDALEPPPNAEMARMQYYSVKFGMNTNTHEGTQEQRLLFRSYLEGLQWVLNYYYQGPESASWSWYYPFYHAPMVVDLITYDQLVRPRIRLDVGRPFRPFQQLMAVLPANSKSLLPQCYQWLFDSPDSPVAHFYPKKFEVDLDGVKVPWGGVTLIPWIDPLALLEAMDTAERRGPPLTEAELRRNELGEVYCFRYDPVEAEDVPSPLPRFRNLSGCRVRGRNFTHPAIPPTMAHFPHDLLPGCKLRSPGFPCLALHELTGSMERGLRVFQCEARGESLILHLHPKGPMVPAEEALLRLLRSPCVLPQYPTVRRGKVEAIHTARAKLLPNGRWLHNDVSEHENLVWYLVQEWRKRGLVVEFDGRPEEQTWHQPVAAVRAVESSYVDPKGRTQYRFASTCEYCLLHLLRKAETHPADRPRTLAERFAPGTVVLCIAPDTVAFGQVGVVEDRGPTHLDDAAAVQACFRLGLARAEQEALQLEIQQVVVRQHLAMRWWDIASVAKQVELDIHVTWQILGSLMARGADNVREDLGMNLMCETWDWDGNVAVPLCLPTYSARRKGTWMFSDLAVNALKDYREKFPGLFLILRNRRARERDLDMRLAFPDSADSDYSARQLVKYCTSCPFKKLRLVPEQYMALAAPAIVEVVRAVDRAYAKLQSRPACTERITGIRRIYRAIDADNQLPSGLLSSGDVRIGQRGVYVKPKGPVPFGTKGTVLGIYGTGTAQVLELILDEEVFGATDLSSRTPSMRGLHLSTNDFMPLLLHAPEAAARTPCSRSLYSPATTTGAGCGSRLMG